MAKGDPWMVVRRAREFASYHCVVAPLLGGGSFDLIAGAHVTALRSSTTAGRIDAVEYVDVSSGQRRTLAACAVVVAAGCIDSTVLLLRSRSADFPRGLGNTAGVLGRYLHDHPREWWPAQIDRPMRALAHPIYIGREPAATNDPPLLATSLTIGLGERLERLKTYYRGRSRAIGVQVFGTMVPEDTVGVSLAGDDDGSVDRRPVISVRFDERTRANLTASRQRLQDVFADAGTGVAVTGPFHDLRPGSAYHYGGSVRMHRLARVRGARRMEPRPRGAERARRRQQRVHDRAGEEPDADGDGAGPPRGRPAGRRPVDRGGAVKVVILAGGMGSRLSEETQVRPKPMVEIGHRPILWHIMQHYAHFGFNDFVICLGYHGEYIKKYFSGHAGAGRRPQDRLLHQLGRAASRPSATTGG